MQQHLRDAFEQELGGRSRPDARPDQSRLPEPRTRREPRRRNRWLIEGQAGSATAACRGGGLVAAVDGTRLSRPGSGQVVRAVGGSGPR